MVGQTLWMGFDAHQAENLPDVIMDSESNSAICYK